MSTESARSPVGRPRDQNADKAILAATFKHLIQHGYARMSIEGIAAEAGVGKTTIYRRFANKQELAAAAITSNITIDNVVDVHDTLAEIGGVLDVLTNALIHNHALRIIGTLLAEEVNDPELLAVFRKRVILPRRDLLRQVLLRGIRNAQVRDDLDVEVAIDFISSVAVGRYLSGDPVDSTWTTSVLDSFWHMIRR